MTSTPTTTQKGEVTMSFSVFCPCGCAKVCTAHDAGFSATTVEITGTCFGVPVVERKSQAYARAVPETVLIHRDGLVALA